MQRDKTDSDLISDTFLYFGYLKLTQDMLLKQEEQELTIKKCRNKVDCMTDEMKMFQRMTTEDATPKQVSNGLA